MGVGGQDYATAILPLGKRPILLYNGYQVPFLWVNRPGSGHDRTPCYIWHLLNGCMFLLSAGGAVQNCPLHCRPYFIYRWRRRKTKHNLSFHKNYVFVKNALNPSSCTAISWYCYWSSYLIYFTDCTLQRVVIYVLVIFCASVG
jgi:hypothetical protein